MDIVFLKELANSFREALDVVVMSKSYGRLTIFNNFPHGCCRYTSDLLAEYLMSNHIPANRIQMIESESIKEGYTHCWLLVDDRFYVDITADQFNGKPYFKKYEPIPSCYVGLAKVKYLYDDFDNSRMQHLCDVGIESYSTDISFKLKYIYDKVIEQIDINSK